MPVDQLAPAGSYSGAPRHAPPDGSAEGRALRVAHVAIPIHAGGLESVVRMLAASQREHGVDARVVAVDRLTDGDHPFVLALQEIGVPVIRVASRGGALAERRAVEAALDRIAPDVVHTHGYRADILHGTRAAARGWATCTTMHGFIPSDWKVRAYQWLQLRAARRMGAVVAVSRPLADTLAAHGVPAARVALLPNAYVAAEPPLGRAAARAALGLPDEGLHLGWVGRVSVEKGLDVAVRALAAMRRRDAILSVVGDGPHAEEVGSLAAALGVADRVRWHGLRSPAAPLLPAFDVVVMSSRTEGMPIALFEAMDAGVPVVAAAVGGIPDVLRDVGVLVPPARPDLLAEAIDALVAEPARGRELAGLATERLRREFGAREWVARHESLYRRLVSAH